MYKLKEVSLEITNECMLKCVHCSSNSGKKIDDELPHIKWMALIADAHKLDASVVSLSGGDPLCYPQWKELVSYIKELGMKCLFYTCGEGMTEKDVDFLKNNNATIIYSLEGAKKDTHNYITGKDTYSNVIKLIKYSVGINADVETHFTPMRLNYLEIVDFLNLVESLGVKKASFLRLVPQGRAWTNFSEVMLNPLEFLEVQKRLYEYKGNVKYRIGCPLSFGHLLGYVEHRPRCHAGQDLLLIRPDGDVHCCAGWKNCDKLVLGNVRKTSLEDIWNNSSILKFIRLFIDGSAKGFCADCPWNEFCGGGCIAQRVILNKIIGWRNAEEQVFYGTDPMCPRWNNLLNDNVIKQLRTRIGKRQDSEGVVYNE